MRRTLDRKNERWEIGGHGGAEKNDEEIIKSQLEDAKAFRKDGVCE